MKDIKEITEKNPFRVPERYLEELNDRIIASNSGKKPEEKPKGLLRRLKPVLAAAATVAVLVLLGFTAMKVIRGISGKTAALPEMSFQEFSDTYLNDIDILTLEEGSALMASDNRVPDVADSDIIDFLMLENVDLNDIYEIL